MVVPIFKGKGDIQACGCYRAVKLHEHGMMVVEWLLEKRAISMVVPIFKGKGDIQDCGCYRAVKLHEHGMMVVEWLLEKKGYKYGGSNLQGEG